MTCDACAGFRGKAGMTKKNGDPGTVAGVTNGAGVTKEGA